MTSTGHEMKVSGPFDRYWPDISSIAYNVHFIQVAKVFKPNDILNQYDVFDDSNHVEVVGLKNRRAWDLIPRISTPASVNIMRGRYVNSIKNV